jgi:hypothetical protein
MTGASLSPRGLPALEIARMIHRGAEVTPEELAAREAALAFLIDVAGLPDSVDMMSGVEHGFTVPPNLGEDFTGDSAPLFERIRVAFTASYCCGTFRVSWGRIHSTGEVNWTILHNRPSMGWEYVSRYRLSQAIAEVTRRKAKWWGLRADEIEEIESTTTPEKSGGQA